MPRGEGNVPGKSFQGAEPVFEVAGLQFRTVERIRRDNTLQQGIKFLQLPRFNGLTFRKILCCAHIRQSSPDVSIRLNVPFNNCSCEGLWLGLAKRMECVQLAGAVS